MNPFTEHPKQQGITYSQHAVFAMTISARLLISVLAFATHAILPFISIDKTYDLQAMIDFLQRCNNWIAGSGSNTADVDSSKLEESRQLRSE